MTSLYLSLPKTGSIDWADSVPDLAGLPAQGVEPGEARLVRNLGQVYWWNGVSWVVLTGGSGATDTDGLTPSTMPHTPGHLGEIISNAVTTPTATGVAASGSFGAVTSISLPTGDWQLTGVAGFNENGATLTDSMSAGFSNTADGSGLGALDFAVYNNLISSTSDLVAPVPVLNVFVPIGPNVTYYLNTRLFYSAGSPRHYGNIFARRMT